MTHDRSSSGWLGTPLDSEDAARLWMDTRENPMIVTALLRLDRPLDLVTFTEVVAARALTHDRLRARIAPSRVPFLRPRWREDRRVSIADHVGHVWLPPGSGDEELARALSRIASEPMDRARPLWRAWLVDGDGDRSAIVVRIHHAVADGFALLGVLYGFSDEGAGMALPAAVSVAVAPPRSTVALVRRTAALARLLTRRSEAPTALAGCPRGEKALAWSAPIAVAAIRAAARRVEAHVNDVVLGALAGALRALILRGAAVPCTALHALVPVALPHVAAALGNHYASLFVRLPIDVGDARDRVISARDAMQEARAASGVELGRALVGAAFALGARVERVGVRLLSRKASLVASNVAGPLAPLHVAGRRIDSIVFAAPAPGSVALSASAFSYAGELRVTISADTAVMPDPWLLVRLFEDEMARTLAALLGAAASPA